MVSIIDDIREPIGFRSFIDYLMLKAHFSEPKFVWNRRSNYSRISLASFDKRKDKKFFQSLERRMPFRDERLELIISSFLQDNQAWIGSIEEDDFHKKRIVRISYLESLFKQDCEKLEFWLFDRNVNFCNVCLTSGLEPCILIAEANQIGVNIETLALLNEFSGYLDEWFPIHPLWKEKKMKYEKYGKILVQMDKNVDQMRKVYEEVKNIAQVA